MAHFKKVIHPLGWGDIQLLWLLVCGPNRTGLNNRAIYHAMGYIGRQPTPGFLVKLNGLKQRINAGEFGDVRNHPELLQNLQESEQ